MQASVAPLIIVATRGRPHQTEVLLEVLGGQTRAPALTVVIGSEVSDLPAVQPMHMAVERLLTRRPGLTRQRNLGLTRLRELGLLNGPSQLVVFFDDDFRPASDWLARAEEAFASSPDLVGLTGHVLGDGIGCGGLSEEQAQDLLNARRRPLPHWSSVTGAKDVESLYGCNMAFRARVAQTCNFDEELALYGWQEDCDYTGQARRWGRTQIRPTCRGVHLGAGSARQSGLRMGYSQIANPIRIAGRGNMTRVRMLRFLSKALLANLAKSAAPPPQIDYRGRLQGNLLAMSDVALSRCRPGRILDL